MKFLKFDLSEFFHDIFSNSYWNILKSTKQYFNQPSPQHQSIQMPSSARRRKRTKRHLREEPHVHHGAPHQVSFPAPPPQLWMIPRCATAQPPTQDSVKNAETQLRPETQ